MNPGNSELAILLQAMWKTGDADFQAYAGNYRFDERVSTRRQQAYEAALPAFLSLSGFKEWDRWHRGVYRHAALHREVPATFTDINADAAHAGLAPGQDMVRIEALDHALGEMRCSVDDLETLLEVARTGKGHKHYTQQEAQDRLVELCDSLNSNPNAVRPRFAGFLQDVEDSLAAPDWANQLRDRFGLAHHSTAAGGPPIPVALMRYSVRDVMTAARDKADAVHPICVPTVLDAEFTRCFVPSPHDLPYGRTLDLADDERCERKIAEVLHLRLEYRPEHVFRIGAITTGLTVLERLGLAALREHHFFCLCYDCGRDDFGAPPVEWRDA